MKNLSKIKSLLYGAATIILWNLIIQDDWEAALLAAGILLVGGIIIEPLVTFMTNNKKNQYYK